LENIYVIHERLYKSQKDLQALLY